MIKNKKADAQTDFLIKVGMAFAILILLILAIVVLYNRSDSAANFLQNLFRFK